MGSRTPKSNSVQVGVKLLILGGVSLARKTNLTQPESADEIGSRKVVSVLSTNADLLASANPGCTLQIQKILRESGQKLPAAHALEILDASISGTRL